MGYKKDNCTLEEKFPKTNAGILRLLKDMLEFNPFFRPTAKECLQNKIFDNIRVAGLEVSAPFKINIDVDRNEYKFDYENSEANESKIDTKKEIQMFKIFVLEEF